jgi:hypothetical protein
MSAIDTNTDLPIVNEHFPEKFQYDVELLTAFHNMIFERSSDSEFSLAWRARNGNIPSFPNEAKKLISSLARSPVGSALYYSTATVTPDRDGKLFNRQANFAGLYVIVLDDIGTKIPVDKIPENFAPTYIIETSKGNFQYGYVLEEPIRSLHAAKALVQCVYESGLSDEGGKMPNKLVRLPHGINGKKGDKGKFHVKLHTMDGKFYTPEEILAVVEPDLKWEDILKDSEKAQARLNKSNGVYRWTAGAKEHQYDTVDGIVDPILEHLAKHNMVFDDSGDWVKIECPWCDSHTSGGDDAGYSPIGRGAGAFRNKRAFKCFHEHCADKTTNDFLIYIVDSGGDRYPIYEPHPDIASRFFYDAFQDGIHEQTTHGTRFYSSKVLTNVFTEKIDIPNDKGITVRKNEMQHFLKEMSRSNKVVVDGQKFDPTTHDVIVRQEGSDSLYINSFKPPRWSDGEYDPEIVKEFTDYVNYLIPNEREYNYFLDWMACKAQNMGFRGQAIVMVATTQGMGRTTLSKMIGCIFGHHNMTNVPFEKLTEGGQFNEFLAFPFVVSDETLAVAKDDSVYKVYERLKDMVDTTPKYITINGKYSRKYSDYCYSSFLMLSNHTNALMISAKDRRFYAITNAKEPASPEYFGKINRMINDLSPIDDNSWAAHVWRFLRNRPVNPEQMVKDAGMTVAKQEMAIMSQSLVDFSINFILENWDFNIISSRDVREIIDGTIVQHDMNMSKNFKQTRINALFAENTIAFDVAGKRFKVDGNTVKLGTFTEVINGMTKKEVLGYLQADHKLFDEDLVEYRKNRAGEMARLKEALLEELEYHNKI